MKKKPSFLGNILLKILQFFGVWPYEKVKNPTFEVIPINSVKEIQGADYVYERITEESCPLISLGTKAMKAELIPFDSGSINTILKRVDERGFVPAPTNLLLGLIAKHRKDLMKYGRIIAPDLKNAFTLDGRKTKSSIVVNIEGNNVSLHIVDFRFAVPTSWMLVVKKTSLQESQPIETNPWSCYEEEASPIGPMGNFIYNPKPIAEAQA